MDDGEQELPGSRPRSRYPRKTSFYQGEGDAHNDRNDSDDLRYYRYRRHRLLIEVYMYSLKWEQQEDIESPEEYR